MSPLHRAIIEDSIEELTDKVFVDQWFGSRDPLGFIPLEIAKLLGKYDAMKLLGGELPGSFFLQPNGVKEPVELSLEGFEKAMGIRYRPFLTFPSYPFLKEVVKNCPYILRSRSLASDNYAWTKMYQKELVEGVMSPITIKWIDATIGYGAFALQDLSEGIFIGEYTGSVRRLFRRHPDQNPYCFHYPTKLWSLKYFAVDSMHEGNLTRFINHSNTPNLYPLCLVDRGLLHQVLIAARGIKRGEQLTFDYGEDYWIKRKSLLRPLRG